MAEDSIDTSMSPPPSEGDAPDEGIEIEKFNTTGKKKGLDQKFCDDFNYLSYWSDKERPMPKHMQAIKDFTPRPQATHFDISTPEGRAEAIEHLSNPDNNLATQRPAQLRILHSWKSQVSQHSLLACYCQFPTDNEFYLYLDTHGKFLSF
jgi:hypothetical protein